MTQPAESFDEADAPPHDLDAEGLVLSWSLEHGAVPGLLPEHFYSHANQRVYEVILLIAERGEPLDVVAVARELRALGRYQQVGGSRYVGMLASCIPATANVESHAAAIRELYRRRVLSDALLKLRVELRQGVTTSSAAWARCKAICEEMTAGVSGG
jgi:replicative DNA helicase